MQPLDAANSTNLDFQFIYGSALIGTGHRREGAVGASGGKVARRVADRVLFMDHGRILEDRDTHAFFSEPHTARAREFLSTLLQHDLVDV